MRGKYAIYERYNSYEFGVITKEIKKNIIIVHVHMVCTKITLRDLLEIALIDYY